MDAISGISIDDDCVVKYSLIPVESVEQQKMELFANQSLKIGRRNDNDIVINEDTVHPIHAVLKVKKNCFILQDMGSATGTFVKILGEHQLNVGEILEIGSFHF